MEKETHLSKSNSKKPLVFYKLIVDPNDYNKLRIPGKFIKSIGNELSAVAALSTPCGHRCYVELAKEGNKLWFCGGWKEFIQTYSVCAGQFLVFRYEGDSTFSVGIFNTNEVNYLDLLSCSEKLTDSQQCQSMSEDGLVADELLNQNLACLSSECLENCVPDQCKDPERADNSDPDYALLVQKFASSSFVYGQGIKKNDGNAGSLKRMREPAQQQEDGNTKKSHQLVRNISPETYRANLSNSKNNGKQEMPSEKKGSQRVTPMSRHTGVQVSKNYHKESSAELELSTPEKDGLRTLAVKRITPENLKHRKEENGASYEACPDKFTQNNADAIQGKTKAIEAAAMFKSNLPFCWTLLRPSDVNEKALLNMPSSFARKHLSTYGTVTLKLSDGNHWFVHATNNSGEVRLSRGWNRFVKDNKLVEGDVCVFELTETKDDAVLKVSIFRNAEDGDPSNQCRMNVHVTTSDLQGKSAEDNTIQYNDSRFSKSVGDFESHSSSEEQHGTETTKITSERTDLSNHISQGNSNIKGKTNTFKSCICRSIQGRTMGVKEEKKQIQVAAKFESSNPFCKIQLRSSHLNYKRAKLNIPSTFAGKYLKLQRGIIKLEISGGQQWSMIATNYCGRTYLSGGWIHFVRDMRLEEGDVCVFELINTEDIVLKVTIFRQDKAASTNQLQSNVHSVKNTNDLPETGQTTPNGKSTDENFHIPSTRCDAAKRTRAGNALNDEQLAKRTKKSNACDNSADMCQSTEGEADVAHAKERTIHLAKMFTSDNASCRVTMTPSYMRSKKVYIPASFAEKYLKRASERIKLEVSYGKQWLIKVIKTRRGIYLSQGWSQFMRDVQLLDGDVCVFELRKTEDIVLKVTVLRDVRAANQTQSSEHSADSAYALHKTDQRAQAYEHDVEDSRTDHMMPVGIDDFHDTENVQQRNETETVTDQPMDLIDAGSYDPLSKCSEEVMLNDNSTFSDQPIEYGASIKQKKEKAAREAAMFKSSNPFCSVSMRPSYISKNAQLNIPSDFAAKYLRDDCRFIKLEGSDKKQWPVRVIKKGDRGTRLGHQWRDFARVNQLVEGDVCTLERVIEDVEPSSQLQS